MQFEISVADLITQVNLILILPSSLAEQNGDSGSWPAPGGASRQLFGCEAR